MGQQKGRRQVGVQDVGDVLLWVVLKPPQVIDAGQLYQRRGSLLQGRFLQPGKYPLAPGGKGKVDLAQ